MQKIITFHPKLLRQLDSTIIIYFRASSENFKGSNNISLSDDFKAKIKGTKMERKCFVYGTPR